MFVSSMESQNSTCSLQRASGCNYQSGICAEHGICGVPQGVVFLGTAQKANKWVSMRQRATAKLVKPDLRPVSGYKPVQKPTNKGILDTSKKLSSKP